MRIIRITIVLIFAAICLVVVYFEYLRPFNIGLVKYNNNLYEKDFLDNGFTLHDSDQVDYYFQKIVNYNIEGDIEPVDVKAYFSKHSGTLNGSMYHNLSLNFLNKDKNRDVVSFLIEEFGLPKKVVQHESNVNGERFEIIFYEWCKNNSCFRTPYFEDQNELKEFSIEKSSHISVPFNVYLYLRKGIINNLKN